MSNTRFEQLKVAELWLYHLDTAYFNINVPRLLKNRPITNVLPKDKQGKTALYHACEDNHFRNCLFLGQSVCTDGDPVDKQHSPRVELIPL